MELTYETKCKRCGEISEWFFAKLESVNYSDYLHWINEKMQYVGSYHCGKCGKITVHEVVSYKTKPE